MRTTLAAIVAVLGLTLASVAWGNMALRPPPAPLGPDEYVIKAGDTFSSIARDKLGKEALASKIAELNPTLDPNKLKIGQKIKLPPRPAASQPTSQPRSTPNAAPRKAAWDRGGGVMLGLGLTALLATGGLYLARRRTY